MEMEEMETTIMELIQHRDEFKKWDKWDYRIYSPFSLDDLAEIVVVLINKNGSTEEIYLSVA